MLCKMYCKCAAFFAQYDWLSLEILTFCSLGNVLVRQVKTSAVRTVHGHIDGEFSTDVFPLALPLNMGNARQGIRRKSREACVRKQYQRHPIL